MSAQVEVLIKEQIMKSFLEDICWPADSKSLTLRIVAFEMQLSHGILGLSPNCLHRNSF